MLLIYIVGPAAVHPVNGFQSEANKKWTEWKKTVLRLPGGQLFIWGNAKDLGYSAAVNMLLSILNLILQQCINICWGNVAVKLSETSS